MVRVEGGEKLNHAYESTREESLTLFLVRGGEYTLDSFLLAIRARPVAALALGGPAAELVRSATNRRGARLNERVEGGMGWNGLGADLPRVARSLVMSPAGGLHAWRGIRAIQVVFYAPPARTVVASVGASHCQNTHRDGD